MPRRVPAPNGTGDLLGALLLGYRLLGDGLPDAYELANTNPSSATALHPSIDIEPDEDDDDTRHLTVSVEGHSWDTRWERLRTAVTGAAS